MEEGAEVIEGVCAHLLVYCDFLAGAGLVRRAELARFRKRVSGMKGKLVHSAAFGRSQKAVSDQRSAKGFWLKADC